MGKSKLYIWLGVLGIILLGIYTWWAYPPEYDVYKPGLKTTKILKPLNPDGTVNYNQYLNKVLARDLTLDNNAAVLLIQCMGKERFKPAQLDMLDKPGEDRF